MNNPHPTILQALRPCMPTGKTEAELIAADLAYEQHKDSYDARNDAQALRFQMQSENTRTNFGEAV